MNVDKNLSVKKEENNELRWINPLGSDEISIFGFYWLEENQKYHRLPNSEIDLLGKVNPNLTWISKATSGGQLHFITNSKKLTIKAKIGPNELFASMTPVAQRGFDCYVGETFEDVLFYDSTRFNIKDSEYEYTFFDNNQKEVYVIINFPLYAQVEEVHIGIENNASIRQAKPFKDEKRVVVYGTSITQGGCASRPGMSYTNILSRKTKREWINLGFSGNAFGEPELIQVIARISPVDMFIIDYEANAGTNGKLENTLEDLINIIREKHPKTSLVIISRISYLFDVLNPVLGKRRNEIKEFQKDMVEKFRANGDENIYFVDGSKFFGDKFDEFTIDSIHPNDLGFEKIVEGYESNINQILYNRRTENE